MNRKHLPSNTSRNLCGATKLHKDSTTTNPPTYLRLQPIALLKPHASNKFIGCHLREIRTITRSHPSLRRQTHNKTSFSVSRKAVKRVIQVCVCVRGDGEVDQDSCQQAIVWREYRADHTHQQLLGEQWLFIFKYSSLLPTTSFCGVINVGKKKEPTILSP